MLLLSTIPVAAGINTEKTEEPTELLGWTFIRGLVFNMKKIGNDLYFRTIRLHWTEFTGSEFGMGVMRLKHVKVSDLGPDRQLTFGPLGSLTWIVALCHGGITEL